MCIDCRAAFSAEVQLLLSLQHVNLSRLVALSLRADLSCVCTEYCAPHGDLKHFLHQHCAEGTTAAHRHAKDNVIRQGNLHTGVEL